MITEAHKNFDPAWQQLASAPKDGRLDDPVLVARQIVAMSKEKDAFIEFAFSLVDRIVAKEGNSDEEAMKAKVAAVDCFLQTALAQKAFWPDTVVCAIVEAGQCRKAGRFVEAKRLYQAVLQQVGVPETLRAQAMYNLAVCCWDNGLRDTAHRLLLKVIDDSPETYSAWNARMSLCLWYPDSQLTEMEYYRLYQKMNRPENRSDREVIIQAYLKHYPDGRYSERFENLLK